jgi:hypothetical protein
MAVRIVPVTEFGALCVAERYELVEFVKLGRSVWAVLARVEESAALVCA